MCRFNNINECCICKEYFRYYKRCKKCNNAIVCTGCILKMSETGTCDKCPLCRRKDWLYKNLKSKKVVPLATKSSNNEEKLEEMTNNCECNCVKVLTILLSMVIYLVISYAYGFFTLLLFLNGKIEKNIMLYIILPVPLGCLEVLLSTYCCFRFVCKLKLDSFSEYFNMLRLQI